MQKIKYYAWAAVAVIGAVLLAIIRSKNNKIGDLQVKAETSKHDINVAIKTAELKKATESAQKSADKFKQWQAVHAKKYGNTPPEGQL